MTALRVFIHAFTVMGAFMVVKGFETAAGLDLPAYTYFGVGMCASAFSGFDR